MNPKDKLFVPMIDEGVTARFTPGRLLISPVEVTEVEEDLAAIASELTEIIMIPTKTSIAAFPLLFISEAPLCFLLLRLDLAWFFLQILKLKT